MQNFNEAGLPAPLASALQSMGFTTPTPIQAQAIPLAMQGKDILGSAQTGTGKTAAFGIPLIANLINNAHGTALVLVPIRELAIQVMEMLEKLLKGTNIQTALLIGGDPMPKQLKQLRNRPRLIVGTPGRVNDHLSRGTLRLDKTNFLVLDETDRMLDMGFGIQLEQIAKFLPSERQTLMFSATMPHNIMSLSEKYLYEPERISIGATSAPATNVTQEEIHVKESEKYSRLLNELNEREGSVIIFVKTKRSADMLADKLCAANQNADALHGDLQQNKRERVVKAFRNQRYRILVATDIAARGLDIPHIAHVINYDLPQCPEDYVHRIGRTARAGAEGAAVNFITSSDYGKWNAIQRLINPNFVPEKGSNRNNQGQNSNRRSGGGKPRNGNGGRNSKGFAPRSNNSEFRGDSRRSPSQAGSSNSSRDFKPRPPRDSNAFDENNAVRFDDKPKKVSFSITPKRFVSGTPQRPQRSRHAA